MDLFEYEQLQRNFVATNNAGIDFADSKPQKQNRPLKADGAAGKIALALLSGARLSVQDCVRLLAAAGITSNDTARRLREAVTWLSKNHCYVGKRLQSQTNAPDYHYWYISVIGSVQKQLTDRIKGK